MARFYDTTNARNLMWVEDLLMSGGINYSLKILGNNPAVMEIMVAEEDMEEAESLLSGSVYPLS